MANYNLVLKFVIVIGIVGLCLQCNSAKKSEPDPVEFPDELVRYVPYKGNPVFTGTGSGTWDSVIRERGYIIREEDNWYMWYTGYKEGTDRHLGYAESKDGIHWERYPHNPIYSADWVEDMNVLKDGDTYYMFAEGRDDIAHLLTSTDRIHWAEQGPLDIRMVNGDPISKGAYGTPTVWKEQETWYLFYERGDLGVWLARSMDLKRWTNVQDEPVIALGPDPYDKYAVALNQIIKYKGRYYGIYHASAFEDWRKWSTCIVVSDDLIHWKKYDKNPIIGDNNSSGIWVDDGRRLRLYTMHPDVKVFFPAVDSIP